MPYEALTTLQKAVEMHLDRLRPAMIADGGNVELIAVDGDGTVRIAFQGECSDCPAQLATLRIGIEAPLCDAIPGVTAVVPV
jgi:Fe-S cluster biogenesis protein NfuA